jgi:hypothetical protein
MGRILYIVARDQPLLCGYLMNAVRGPSRDGHRVEIKLDERQGERRLQCGTRDPERRRGERRRQPNYDSDLRSRGYVTVVQSEAAPSQGDQPTRERVKVWRRRSSWWRRAARGRPRIRVRRARWGLSALLLGVVGVSFVVGRSLYQTADRSIAPSVPRHRSRLGRSRKLACLRPPRRPKQSRRADARGCQRVHHRGRSSVCTPPASCRPSTSKLERSSLRTWAPLRRHRGFVSNSLPTPASCCPSGSIGSTISATRSRTR